MFIKQHSMFDVLTAFLMAGIMYIVVYQADIVSSLQSYRAERSKRRYRQI